MDTSNIGNKIKAKRQQLNMTQKDLAKAMSISNQLVSKWETGESVPSLEYLDILCQTLKVDITYFISTKKEKQKSKNPLVTKIVALVVALFIGIVGLTFECLVINFTIIPAACKNHYLENIEESINKTLSLGYYNIELVGKLDDDIKVKEYNQGYIDDDGNPVCYNSEDPNKDISNIHTLEELFDNQFSFEDTDVSLEDDDIKYIRKTSYGYYIEMKESVWRDELTNTQKKNYKLTHKITCKVYIRSGYFNSMTMTVKYKDKPSNEDFTITSTITCKQEKPDINKQNPDDSLWNIYLPNCNETEFINKFPSATLLDLDTETQSRIKRDLRELNGCLYYADYGENTITILDPETFSFIKTFYINGNLHDTYAYNNNLYYSYSYVSGDGVNLGKIDLTTWKQSFLAENIIRSAGGNNYVSFNSKYVYAYEYDSSYTPQYRSRIYDLETETFIHYSTESNKGYRYLDSTGKLYYRDYSKSYANKTLYIEGCEDKLIGESVVGELDGCIYTQVYENYKYVFYKYNNNKLVDTLTELPAPLSIKYVKINQTHAHNFADKIFLDGTNNYQTIKQSVSINGVSPVKTKILGFFDNKLLVCYNFSDYGGKILFTELAYYNLNNLSKPAMILKTNDDMLAYATTNGTLLAIKQTYSTYNYYLLK